MCAAVRKVRTRYNESVRSGQRDGSVERTVCGSKEAACEASRCAAADSVSFGGAGDGDGDGGTEEEGWGVGDTSEGLAGALTRKKKKAGKEVPKNPCEEERTDTGGVPGVDGVDSQ